MDTKFRRIIRVKKNNTVNFKNRLLRYFKRRFLHGIFDGNLCKLILYGLAGQILRLRYPTLRMTEKELARYRDRQGQDDRTDHVERVAKSITQKIGLKLRDGSGFLLDLRTRSSRWHTKRYYSEDYGTIIPSQRRTTVP